MICVSIGRGRHRHMIAEHQHLVEQGAELVELRVDYINGDVNLKRLLADKVGPVIITCRRQQDGGKWAGSEEARLMLLRTAIATSRRAGSTEMLVFVKFSLTMDFYSV